MTMTKCEHRCLSLSPRRLSRQLDELTQQLTPLLATLDASTLAHTEQVARPVFDCRRVIQVENDGTQAMLASLIT